MDNPYQTKANLFSTIVDSTLHLLVNNGFTMSDIAQFGATLTIRALSKVELCEPGTTAKLKELDTSQE